MNGALVVGILLASVIAGIAVGILYACIYIRLVYKKWINLRILIKLLFKAPLVYRRSNPLPSYSKISYSTSSRTSYREVQSTIPVAVAESGFPNNTYDMRQNTSLASGQDITESQRSHRLVEAEEEESTDFSQQNQVNNPLAPFLDELERNRSIISEFTGDKLLLLETSCWEANKQLVNNMAPDLKNHLIGLYDDIALVNNLVWLSTEFNRLSPNMRDLYTRLIGNIAADLEKILQVVTFFDLADTDLAST